MSDANKHGLTRYIPEKIKYQLRKEAGFGCAICGNAIFEYEHIDPEWINAKEHDPDRMTILCGSCHNNVTRGFTSKEKVFQSKEAPKCKETGTSQLGLELIDKSLIVELGGIQFVNTPTILNFDAEVLLKIDRPEEAGGPPRISARLYDRNEKNVAIIDNNCWNGNSDNFDIKTEGSRIIIKNANSQIDLAIKILQPNKIIIERINMKYSGYRIVGDINSKFQVITPKAELHLPHGIVKVVQNATSGITISESDIQFGSDECLLAKCKNFRPLSPNLNVQDCKIEFFRAKDHPDPPVDVDDSAILYRISDKDGHWVEFCDIQIEEIN